MSMERFMFLMLARWVIIKHFNTQAFILLSRLILILETTIGF